MLGVKKSKKFLKHLKDFTHPQDNAVKVKSCCKSKMLQLICVTDNPLVSLNHKVVTVTVI